MLEELRTWTKKTMNDFLRATMEPSVIEQITCYILNIENPSEARSELEQTLGLDYELDNHSQSSLLLRNHKCNFIDSYIEKRFAKKPQKKNKAIKVDFTKKNLEQISKELNGPAFTEQKLCYCMAREHELVGNCLACGKIVCAIEGRGACLFCGHQIVAKGQVPNSLPDKNSLIQAIKHKDKLIDYDRNAEERLAVIDDQNDWFDIANNTWLSAEDREKALQLALDQQKRSEEAEKLISLSINFSNASVDVDVGSQRLLDSSKKENTEAAQKFFTQASKTLHPNKDLSEVSRRIYDSIMESLPKPNQELPKKTQKVGIVQNEDPFMALESEVVRPPKFDPLVFTEKDDKRMCLTMHQPWASLLVLGYKRFEGREWSTDFRGPLWIHAGGKKVSTEEIQVVENQCKAFFERNNQKPPVFPTVYQTGVLLGRVELVDVLSNDQYKKVIKDEEREESESKYLFVVKNPQRLLVPIRMDGSKKLYPLDFNTWDGAKYGLRRVG